MDRNGDDELREVVARARQTMDSAERCLAFASCPDCMVYYRELEARISKAIASRDPVIASRKSISEALQIGDCEDIEHLEDRINQILNALLTLLADES